MSLNAHEIERIFIVEFLRRMDAQRHANVPDPDEREVADELAHDIAAATEFAPKFRSRWGAQ